MVGDPFISSIEPFFAIVRVKFSQRCTGKTKKGNLLRPILSHGTTAATTRTISQNKIVFRFRKDIQSEKGWSFDILCVMRSPGLKGICTNALLCAALIGLLSGDRIAITHSFFLRSFIFFYCFSIVLQGLTEYHSL